MYKFEGMGKVKENIERNPKYKLPWTIGELEAAKLSIIEKIRELTSQSHNP
jgi:hypothetical protein